VSRLPHFGLRASNTPAMPRLVARTEITARGVSVCGPKGLTAFDSVE
jgi:hypothetical protein